jgi:hypothetical protein
MIDQCKMCHSILTTQLIRRSYRHEAKFENPLFPPLFYIVYMRRCKIMQHILNCIAMSMWHTCIVASYSYHNVRFLRYITYTFHYTTCQYSTIRRFFFLLTVSISNISIIMSINVVLFCVPLSYHITKWFSYEWNVYFSLYNLIFPRTVLL